jgi:protein-S-isoprenylcysteine O-methyltransferase Ste14
VSEPPGQQAEPEPDAGSADSAAAPDSTKLPALGPNGEGWFVLQIVFFFAIVTAGLVAGGQWVGPLRFGTAVAGSVLILGGALLVFFGIRDLDRSLSPLPRPKASAVLIQDGIYRTLRHPIYAGVILIAVGWSLLMASFLALGLAIALALLLDLKARREEIWLRDRFPGYAEYALHTKRFVPGVY